MSVFNRRDPYPQEVGATIHRVMERLCYSNPYQLLLQHKVGLIAGFILKQIRSSKGFVNGRFPIVFISDHIDAL